MTARRRPRISDGPNDFTFDDADTTPEHDLARSIYPRYTLSTSLSKRSSQSATVLHPSLTNYGPESAAAYFREALKELSTKALDKAKQKELAISPRRSQPRHGFQRSTHKTQNTIFDDSDGADTSGDEHAVDEADISLFRDISSSSDAEGLADDKDMEEDLMKMGILNQSQAQLPGQSPSDDMNFPARSSDVSVSQLPTYDLRASHRRSRRLQKPEIRASMEDSATNAVPETNGTRCTCRMMCFCEPEVPTSNKNHSSQTLQSSSQAGKSNTFPRPPKPFGGRARGSPSKLEAVSSSLGRSSTARRPPTRFRALMAPRRRAQDFEEHAAEKRRSWRDGGDDDLFDEELDLSELDSMGSRTPQLSPSASNRLRRRLGIGSPQNSIPDLTARSGVSGI